jgi:hypothetical protein
MLTVLFNESGCRLTDLLSRYLFFLIALSSQDVVLIFLVDFYVVGVLLLHGVLLMRLDPNSKGPRVR